ncbi:aromatic ring-hydroxylating dioxygenase subunit alpha [Parasphingopyxis marina]|uniref:Rieske 2Fe-2S domain-containing protein n=1 Tax=Parasphingopyxis marina TaxID=2761622 RepID=A0A842I1H6_9SPHN|nr:aromatic ring-hydroxylating dioxygenase subunit alpha [Parasphingopyxis marina]MBC2778747.1 Rieske 2Fe-2S domain-containing protein [Parasphingopyxis marina]
MYPFSEGSFAVRNGWYVAGFSADLGSEPIARTILGMPVALYRKADGTAVAVGGRCPHRNFPLGKSCVKGDDIVCGYHGIAFGPDGKCTDIPSQKVVPGSYQIPTYPLVEHGMWLWIWPGDPENADPAKLPDLEAIGYADPTMHAVPMFTHEVACRYQLLNDNLLDLSHLAFLHASSIGNLENATVPEETSQEPGILRSRRYIKDAPPIPSLRERMGEGFRVDQVVGMDFYLPGFHAGIGDHFYSASDPDRPGEAIQISRVFHAVTPATPTSCYYFFGLASLDRSEAEARRARLADVIDEDIFASVEIEKMIGLMGGAPDELMIKSDRNAVLGRRMLQAMMDAEGEEEEPFAAA